MIKGSSVYSEVRQIVRALSDHATEIGQDPEADEAAIRGAAIFYGVSIDLIRLAIEYPAISIPTKR